MQKRKLYKILAVLMIYSCISLAIFISYKQLNKKLIYSGHTCIWSRQQAQNFKLTRENTAPYINPDFKLAAPNLWIWDTWPLTKRDGSIATINGYMVIFALTAPRSVDWNKRHDVAVISYFYSMNGRDWIYRGPAYNVIDALGSDNGPAQLYLMKMEKFSFSILLQAGKERQSELLNNV